MIILIILNLVFYIYLSGYRDLIDFILIHTCFLLKGETFTLSLKTFDVRKTPAVKHITIFKLDGKDVCINKDKIYPSLIDLIGYHKRTFISLSFLTHFSLKFKRALVIKSVRRYVVDLSHLFLHLLQNHWTNSNKIAKNILE